MQNKLTDLNNHLFAQLERLGDEELSPEQIETEAQRAKAIVSVSEQVLESASVTVQAMKVASDNGLNIGSNEFLGLESK